MAGYSATGGCKGRVSLVHGAHFWLPPRHRYGCWGRKNGAQGRYSACRRRRLRRRHPGRRSDEGRRMDNATYRHAAAPTPLHLLLVYGNRRRRKHNGFPDFPRHHRRRDQVRPPPRAQTPHPPRPPPRTGLHPAPRAVRFGPSALPSEQKGLAPLAVRVEHGGRGAATE